MEKGNTVFVTAFDFQWNRLGSATFQATLLELGDPAKLDVLGLHALRQAKFLPECVRDVHVLFTMEREPTVEEAKKWHEGRWRERHSIIEV